MYKNIGMSSHGRVPMQQYGTHRMNHRFYFRPQFMKSGVGGSALPLSRTFYSTPKVDAKFQHAFYTNETVEMTSKDNLDETETLRTKQERDFYQDHTYWNEWIQRAFSEDQKKGVAGKFDWMMPGFQIEPWIWYPGDTVEVTSGEFTGQRGVILNVVTYKNQAFVQNVNVQSITIPATDTRPEQNIQREHPIPVTSLKLVDPSSNEPCEVRLVTVRDKETGEKVQRRMSLATGTLLPLPKKQESVDIGDPIHDTPFEDAREPTYLEDKELPLMVARKLRSMEDYFVLDLQEAHTRHDKYRKENEDHLRAYQQEVVLQAAGFVMEQLIRPTSSDVGSDATDSATLDAASAAAGPLGAPEFVSQEHWLAATDDVELPDFAEDEIEDLHGVLDLDNPRMRHAV